ncbi:hypothetical protein CCHL11_09004 [Colletotrichum chlorophyti]|uniref:Uncharacterized protein n=1 Tax=Colletotrichum chlorophyti TaxID=708187 RepID=A0A1Q8RWV2_9PEZI|nr:hypothetical protein CCHL11_09004 [Colletotrichum chlorophyti]
MPNPFRKSLTAPASSANDYGENASILRNKNGENGQFKGLPATKRPLRSVLIPVISRWAITMAIILSIYTVIIVYSNRSVMDQSTKRMYNALITGLSIALGLAVASSLNHMVAELRWWILSRRYRSKRKVELILAADNLKHTIMLAVRSKRWSIHVAALGWLLLSIGSQIGLAALGLCFSTETADKKALLVPGNVSIANVATIETERVVKSKSNSQSALQYTANSYGTMSLSFDTAELSDAPSARAIYVASDPLMFCTDRICKYVFHETSTESITNQNSNEVTVATNRSINSTASCNAWPVTSGGDGTVSNVTVALEGNQTYNFTMPVRGGTDQTTFMTDSEFNCGDGCSIVTAFEASDTSPWYYVCNVTVSPVANATRSEHQVGSELASLASAGIALQGYAASSLVNDTNFQYQSYPAESVFGTPMNGTTADMEAMLARFSIGIVAIAAETNEDLVVDGYMPMKGTKLSVSHWNLIHFILILTASLQLTLGIAAAWVANRVVVPDGGAVEIAQVMRTMAIRDRMVNGEIGEKGSTIGTKSSSLWIYRDTLVSKDGVYDLHMEEQKFHHSNESGMIEMDQHRPDTSGAPTLTATKTL